MAQYVDTSALDGFFKEVYADQLENLIPESSILTKKIKFAERDKIGDGFHQPVVLNNEGGITFAASNSSAFALNASIAQTLKDAVIDGYQMLMRSSIDYESAAKASGSKQAFGRTTEQVVTNMLESMTKYLEIELLYGQIGVGTTSTSVNASATSTVVTLTAASWAAGIWSGFENHKIQFYNSTTLISSSTDAVFTVSSVDIDNKAITVTGSATGISDLDTAAQASGAALTVYFNGAYSNEPAGVEKIITNTGTLFGINAATYALWKGNTYAVSGAITVAKIYAAVAKAVSRGLAGKVCLTLNPEVWSVVMNELSGDRRFDGSYKRNMGENGFENVTLYSSSGPIEIIPHIYNKIGDGFILPENKCKRIGATDITFNNPGTGGKFFRELNDNAGYELRSYSHQALFIERPAETVKLTGITV